MRHAELDAVVAVDGSHLLHVPLLDEPADTAGALAAVTTMPMATFDDKPIATITQASFVLMKAAIDALDLDLRESISRLRHLRDVAARLDCPVAAWSIMTLIAAQIRAGPPCSHLPSTPHTPVATRL
jgi:hypothetical protein